MPDGERFKIIYGEDVDTAYLRKIRPVDRSCYEEKYWGDVERLAARFRKNRRSFIFIEDTQMSAEAEAGLPAPEGGFLAGYINFFPCESPLYRDNIGAPRPDGTVCDRIRDDDITPEEVADYRTDGNHLFILSLAIHADYRDGIVVRMLTDAFARYLARLQQEGFPITDITATAVSEDGKKALARWCFRELRTLGDGCTVLIGASAGIILSDASNK